MGLSLSSVSHAADGTPTTGSGLTSTYYRHLIALPHDVFAAPHSHHQPSQLSSNDDDDDASVAPGAAATGSSLPVTASAALDAGADLKGTPSSSRRVAAGEADCTASQLQDGIIELSRLVTQLPPGELPLLAQSMTAHAESVHRGLFTQLDRSLAILQIAASCLDSAASNHSHGPSYTPGAVRLASYLIGASYWITRGDFVEIQQSSKDSSSHGGGLNAKGDISKLLSRASDFIAKVPLTPETCRLHAEVRLLFLTSVSSVLYSDFDEGDDDVERNPLDNNDVTGHIDGTTSDHHDGAGVPSPQLRLRPPRTPATCSPYLSLQERFVQGADLFRASITGVRRFAAAATPPAAPSSTASAPSAGLAGQMPVGAPFPSVYVVAEVLGIAILPPLEQLPALMERQQHPPPAGAQQQSTGVKQPQPLTTTATAAGPKPTVPTATTRSEWTPAMFHPASFQHYAASVLTAAHDGNGGPPLSHPAPTTQTTRKSGASFAVPTRSAIAQALPPLASDVRGFVLALLKNVVDWGNDLLPQVTKWTDIFAGDASLVPRATTTSRTTQQHVVVMPPSRGAGSLLPFTQTGEAATSAGGGASAYLNLSRWLLGWQSALIGGVVSLTGGGPSSSSSHGNGGGVGGASSGGMFSSVLDVREHIGRRSLHLLLTLAYLGKGYSSASSGRAYYSAIVQQGKQLRRAHASAASQQQQHLSSSSGSSRVASTPSLPSDQNGEDVSTKATRDLWTSEYHVYNPVLSVLAGLADTTDGVSFSLLARCFQQRLPVDREMLSLLYLFLWDHPCFFDYLIEQKGATDLTSIVTTLAAYVMKTSGLYPAAPSAAGATAPTTTSSAAAVTPAAVVVNIDRSPYAVVPSDSLRHDRAMAATIVLLLTNNAAFCASSFIWKTTCPWYPFRHLQDVSVGSLLLVVLTRAVVHTSLTERDEELCTIFVGAIANLTPFVEQIDPYAAQRLVLSTSQLMKRASRCKRTLEERPSCHGVAAELAALEDTMVVLLESATAIAKTKASRRNEALIYELLYYKSSLCSEAIASAPGRIRDALAALLQIASFYEAELSSISGSTHTPADVMAVIVRAHRLGGGPMGVVTSSSSSATAGGVSTSGGTRALTAADSNLDAVMKLEDYLFAYQEQSASCELFFIPQVWWHVLGEDAPLMRRRLDHQHHQHASTQRPPRRASLLESGDESLRQSFSATTEATAVTTTSMLPPAVPFDDGSRHLPNNIDVTAKGSYFSLGDKSAGGGPSSLCLGSPMAMCLSWGLAAGVTGLRTLGDAFPTLASTTSAKLFDHVSSTD